MEKFEKKRVENVQLKLEKKVQKSAWLIFYYHYGLSIIDAKSLSILIGFTIDNCK